MNSLRLQLLGDLEVIRNDEPVALPPSKKTKALLAYLAISERPVRRDRLCELLWDIPDDPKGALRWSLSKIRRMVDGDEHARIVANRSHVSIDLTDVECDVHILHQLAASDLQQVDSEQLTGQLEDLSGEFLEGLELPNQPEYHAWYMAERESVNRSQVKLVKHLLQQLLLRPQLALPLARKQLSLLPFDPQAHLTLVEILVATNRAIDAEQQYRASLKALGNEHKDVLYKALNGTPGQEHSGRSTTVADKQMPYAGTSSAPVADSARKRGDGTPSLAVVPFTNLSEDPEQAYFSDGVTRDIIVALSQFRSMKVIAGDFAHSNSDLEAKDAINNGYADVDYIVEGSVRRSAALIRISVHLIDARNGEHVWAGKYDRNLEDIFAVQDEVSRAIAATVGGRLGDHRSKVNRRASASDLNVYDLILMAQEQHYRMLKDANDEALTLLTSAIELDPENARAYSLLGAVEQINYQMCWSQDIAETLKRALQHGKESIRIEPSDSLAHARLGDTLMHSRRYNEANRHFKRAIDLNPSDSETLALYAEYLRGTGDAKQALEVLDTVRSFDPFDRLWFPWLQGEALFQLEKYDDAISALEEVAEPINDLRLTLAACHAKCGDSDTAAELIGEYLQTAEREMPGFPGLHYADWIEFRKPLTDSRDQVYRLRMKALAKCWPT